MTRNGIAGSYGSSILSFLRCLLLPSTVVVLIYIPTSSVLGFLVSHILKNIYCFLCTWW
jgi:hypothetical protein